MIVEQQKPQVWLVLKRLQEDALLAPRGEYACYEVGRHSIAGYPSIDEQKRILTDLQADKAIKIHRRDFSIENASHAVALEDIRRSDGAYGKGVRFEKLPRFEALYKEYSKYDGAIAPAASKRYWITRENDWYFFDGKPIHFKSSRAKYIKIFKAVYSLIPEGGSVSYTQIRQQCGATKKSVLRALSGDKATFFLHVDIERVPSHGFPLFAPDGKGPRFNFNNEKR